MRNAVVVHVLDGLEDLADNIGSVALGVGTTLDNLIEQLTASHAKEFSARREGEGYDARGRGDGRGVKEKMNADSSMTR